MWPGYTNTPSTSTFSMRIRIIPRYTGFPAAAQVLFGMGGPGTASPFAIELSHLTSGDLRIRVHTGTGAATNYSSTATVSPVSGTAMDIMIVVDGVAETLKSSIDGVELHSGTVTTAQAAFNDQSLRPLIYTGLGIGGANGLFDIVNLEIWDTEENHVYSRSGYDATPAYEGFPIESDVRDNTTYGYIDEVRTGTFAPLTAAEVVTALLDTAVVETGYSVRNSLRLMLAALAGKVSGAPTTSVTIRNPNDTKNRIVATVDSNGNRSAITTDVTD